MSDQAVVVAVRCRPLNRREKKKKCKEVIEIDGNTAKLTEKSGDTKEFVFDYCYGENTEQASVFGDLGTLCLDNAFQGYNSTIFAYGQTGSGKSYSMLGTKSDKGIIPLLCEALFGRSEEGVTVQLEVSYLEIYNEKVKDLLDVDNNPRAGLKVREHPKLGVHVEGLSKSAVRDVKEILECMEEGNHARTVASTKMNKTSSRSHSVFTIHLTKTTTTDDKSTTITSNLNLVDLAGSERQAKTGARGQRLKEAASINKSLSALGNVIAALSDGKKGGYVPYRSSVLTRLLQESLGGNARTIMLAAISPADDNADETLSTLRYADRVKSIVNHVKINETASDKLVRELNEEIRELKAQLEHAKLHAKEEDDKDDLALVALEQENAELRHKLTDAENLQKELSTSFEAKVQQAEERARKRKKVLEGVGIHMDLTEDEKAKTPFLLNINMDPALSKTLVYFLKPGDTTVGRVDASNIRLASVNIGESHAKLANTDGAVALHNLGGANFKTYVNGELLTEEPRELKSGDRIIFGRNSIFRFTDPANPAPAPEGGEEEEDQWELAMRELAVARGQLSSVDEAEEKESFEQQLVRVTEMVDDANEICQAMLKKILFSVELENEEDAKASHDKTIAIRFANLDTGHSRIWSVDAFEDRLDDMKVIFADFLDDGEVSVETEQDPFVDAPEDELIGTAEIPLASLTNLCPIIDRFPIKTPDGGESGSLFVNVQTSLQVAPQVFVALFQESVSKYVEAGPAEGGVHPIQAGSADSGISAASQIFVMASRDSDGRVCFKSAAFDQYLAEADGPDGALELVHGNAEERAWFKLEPNGKRNYMQAPSGKYVAISEDGTIAANAETPVDFDVRIAEGSTVCLRGATGRYIQELEDTLVSDVEAVDRRGCFYVEIERKSWKVVLKTIEGNFISRDAETGEVRAEAFEIDEATLFDITVHGSKLLIENLFDDDKRRFVKVSGDEHKLGLQDEQDESCLFDFCTEEPKRAEMLQPHTEGHNVRIILTIPGAHGLPEEVSSGVYCKFDFPQGGDMEVTDRCNGASANPVFSYRDSFLVPVTSNFVQFLRDSTVPVEVWGHRAIPMGAEQAAAELQVAKAKITELENENKVLKAEKDLAEAKLKEAQAKVKELEEMNTSRAQDPEESKQIEVQLKEQIAAAEKKVQEANKEKERIAKDLEDQIQRAAQVQAQVGGGGQAPGGQQGGQGGQGGQGASGQQTQTCVVL